MSATASEARYRMVVERDLPVPMRDGTILYADLYRPDAPGRFPALVMRTPYDKGQSTSTEREYFATRGYLVIVQDTRGRHSSQGQFVPFVHEHNDGHDTLRWAARLAQCNGVVGSVGQSYLGLVQYLAAPNAPAELRAAAVVSGPITYFEDFIYRRGVFELGWMLGYFITMVRDSLARQGLYEEERARLDSYLEDPNQRFSPLTREHYLHLPLADWGERLRQGAPYFADYLRNWRYGPYWEQTDLRPRLGEIDLPMFHIGSWYDVFQYDTLMMYQGMRRRAKSEASRRAQKLLMGPWAHLLPYSIPTSKGTGEIDFGPAALVELHDYQLRWFDYFLKGMPNGVLEEPPVRIFVMGRNQWREEQEWPLARTRYTELYLHSDGRANSLRGDGRLSFEPPGEQPADAYAYDPRTPVATRGGTVLSLPNGVYDQREIEERADVLVYSGEILDRELEITGPVTLALFASSSAPDTDFCAKLCDVRPDGYVQNLVEGVIRARFRESLSEPSPIKPGEVYRFAIDLWATSHVFKPGHRLRLEITSSNFPRYDRNLNTGDDPASGTRMQVAHQRIFHDARAASHLILPIIPS